MIISGGLASPLKVKSNTIENSEEKTAKNIKKIISIGPKDFKLSHTSKNYVIYGKSQTPIESNFTNEAYYFFLHYFLYILWCFKEKFDHNC